MTLNVKRILAVLLCFAALASCMSRSEKVKTPTIKRTFAKKSTLNDSLVNVLGNFIETAIYEGSAEDFMTKFDLKRFTQIATHTDYSDDKVKKFRKGFISSFSKEMRSFPDKLINAINIGDFYDFIEYYHDPESNNYKILFRFFSEVDGINYHEYHLFRKGNQFFIQDIYVYLTGENLSSTINRLFLQALPPNLLQKIMDVNKQEDNKHLYKAIKSNNELAYKEAKEQLNKINGNLKHDKFYHIMNTLVTANLGDAQYVEAMEEMKKDFADDPTWNLMAIDYYYLKSNFEKTIDAIDKLEEKTGDTFLNHQRGNIAFGMGKYNVAVNYFTKLVEEYPSYGNGRFSLISCYALLENYDKCISLLNAILEDEIYTMPDLIDFVESEEEDGTNELISLAESKTYLNWKAKQKK